MTSPLLWCDVPVDEARVATASAALNVPRVIARLLCQRGLDDPETAQHFLSPSLAHLHDPFLLAGMREAVDRLMAAIARRERIVIHGDYDVDGVTSTILLRRAIELLGGDVDHFVPDRLRDGYGLRPESIERLHAAGARVVVSVDCGIRAVEAAERARALGIDLIITDHHEPETALPCALAVINPKRPDCSYPEKALAGVGVALKVVQALLQVSGRGSAWLPHFVKIAALGTMADVVPLTGENRVIAHQGLAGLSKGPHAAGLAALLEEAGLLGKRIDGFHVGFVLGPRVNAAGRMQTADLALDLLLIRGQDEEAKNRARVLARRLSEENAKRQEQEAAILAAAKRAVDHDLEIGAHNVLVVADTGWHRGIVGIVASKLVETYHKPALVLSVEDGIAYGSARSIPAFDMLAALESCADLFLKFGGHRLAAGVTLEADRVDELRRRLVALAGDWLSPADLIPRLTIHSPLGLREISPQVVEGLSQLAPFGQANPKPVFRAGPVALMGEPRTVKERHLKLLFRQDGRTLPAIAWRAAERSEYLAANRGALELAYSIEAGEYQGVPTMELTVADVRVPAEACV